jgi:hypothetical protein
LGPPEVTDDHFQSEFGYKALQGDTSLHKAEKFFGGAAPASPERQYNAIPLH